MSQASFSFYQLLQNDIVKDCIILQLWLYDSIMYVDEHDVYIT